METEKSRFVTNNYFLCFCFYFNQVIFIKPKIKCICLRFAGDLGRVVTELVTAMTTNEQKN